MTTTPPTHDKQKVSAEAKMVTTVTTMVTPNEPRYNSTLASVETVRPNIFLFRTTNNVRMNAGSARIAIVIPRPGAAMKIARPTAINVIVNSKLAIPKLDGLIPSTI